MFNRRGTDSGLIVEPVLIANLRQPTAGFLLGLFSEGFVQVGVRALNLLIEPVKSGHAC